MGAALAAALNAGNTIVEEPKKAAVVETVKADEVTVGSLEKKVRDKAKRLASYVEVY